MIRKTVRKIEDLDDLVRNRYKRYTEQRDPVLQIIDRVRSEGDKAVLDCGEEFDGVRVDQLRVPESDIDMACSEITKEQESAITTARDRLAENEGALMSKLKDIETNKDGVSKRFVPIASVGCYVPGGSAKYVSSAIMSITPAKIAGVQRVVVATPPNADGSIDSMILAAARICGADEIYKIGGVQAIAALSTGTESVRAVDKIVGPGSIFVTLAKHYMSDQTAIDMLAGPTELGIIADETADPNYLARDLISQAEHSKDTFCCLITTSDKLAQDVSETVDTMTANSNDTIKSSLQYGLCITCAGIGLADVANKLALEHLQIIARDADKISEAVNTAGVILIGENTPSAASDYLLGSDHILPTDRFGRARGPLSVLDFVKLKTTVRSDIDTLRDIAGPMKILTDAEGLPNHYNAVAERLKD